MAYEWVNGAMVWSGAGAEPVIGETKAEYEARVGRVHFQTTVAPIAPAPAPTIAPTIAPTTAPTQTNEQLVYANWQRTGGTGSIEQWRSMGGPLVYTPGGPAEDPQILEGSLGILSLIPWVVGGIGWLWGLLQGEDQPQAVLTGLETGLEAKRIIGGEDMNGDGAQLGYGPGDEPFLDVGGLGISGREGMVSAGRSTEDTGIIGKGSLRAWDPILQRYYQIWGTQAYRNISIAPGNMAPSGEMITRAWVNHAWRKDSSLASTQMGMTANGKMISLSETGVFKSWRPYKSIVIGKSLTSSNVRRVARRIKSHTKSLKKVLSVLK